MKIFSGSIPENSHALIFVRITMQAVFFPCANLLMLLTRSGGRLPVTNILSLSERARIFIGGISAGLTVCVRGTGSGSIALVFCHGRFNGNI
jgi:hypothetical protein